MQSVSVFGVVVPASMHGDRKSWIAIESGAASAVKFSKPRKAWVSKRRLELCFASYLIRVGGQFGLSLALI
jgi:hypothetical protein